MLVISSLGRRRFARAVNVVVLGLVFPERELVGLESEAV